MEQPGLFSFAGGVRYTVKITSQAGPPAPAPMRSSSPMSGRWETCRDRSDRFHQSEPGASRRGGRIHGHGTDSDGGDIFAYSWRSDIDGVLSSSASFSTSALSTGQHTIYFKVQDDMGSWSTETSAHIDVTHQALNIEHIYVALMYGAPQKRITSR